LSEGVSDFAAFLQRAGVTPALDLEFGGDDNPMYHSVYDNFNWVEKFGDPLFHRHVAGTSSSHVDFLPSLNEQYY
jgi:N-acetylated-alpha-linked acidic dipeptidase